jgi:hypothetical protein
MARTEDLQIGDSELTLPRGEAIGATLRNRV